MVNLVTCVLGFLPTFIIRKAFLDSLGNELLGLSSLYVNIISLLSIAELGIGSAIIYSLYKPFAEDNKEKVKGYLNYYAKFYRIVGFTVFLLGLLMAPFLHVFIGNKINILDAQLFFILFLINTLISYLFSYKLCILNVAQDGYKISTATTVSKLLISLAQFAMLKLHPSFYYYILIQIFINTFYYLFMNLYVNKRYNWLGHTVGSITNEEKASLIKNVKAIFLHKIGGVIVFGIDNLVISSFISLTVVGIFNSYNMVIGAIQTIISNAFSGVTNSIGNLLTEGGSENGYIVHKRLFFLSFWVVSVAAITLFNTIKQFVLLWLGEGQVLDSLTINIVLINFYFMLMRGSVERFKEGGGIYHEDRFAPLFEAALNLVSSIILVNVMGLPGVFLGTLISNVCVVFWIKPKMVYKYVFNKRLRDYFKMYFRYLSVGLIPLAITGLATMRLKEIMSVYALEANVIVNVLLINLIYFAVFRNTEEFVYFRNLFINGLLRTKALVKL